MATVRLRSTTIFGTNDAPNWTINSADMDNGWDTPSGVAGLITPTDDSSATYAARRLAPVGGWPSDFAWANVTEAHLYVRHRYVSRNDDTAQYTLEIRQGNPATWDWLTWDNGNLNVILGQTVYPTTFTTASKSRLVTLGAAVNVAPQANHELYWNFRLTSYVRAMSADGVYCEIDEIELILTYTPSGSSNQVSATPSATGTVAFSKQLTAARSLSFTGTGGTALSRLASLSKSLSFSGSGSVALARPASLFRSFAYSAAGAAQVVKGKLFARLFSYAASGSSALSRTSQWVKSLAIAATGTPAVSRAATFLRSLSATATGSPTITRAVALSRQFTAAGSSVLAKGRAFVREFSFAGAGASALSYGRQFIRSFSFTGTGALAGGGGGAPALQDTLSEYLGNPGSVATSVGTVTPAGSNRFGIVKIAHFGVATVNQVMWGATDITANVIFNAVHDVSNRKRYSWFYVLDPPTSATNVQATFSNAPGSVSFEVECWSNVDQTTPYGDLVATPATQQENETPATITITATAGKTLTSGWFMWSNGGGTNTDVVHGAEQTETMSQLCNHGGGTDTAALASATAISDGSVTFSYNITVTGGTPDTTRSAIIAISLTEAAGGGAAGLTKLVQLGRTFAGAGASTVTRAIALSKSITATGALAFIQELVGGATQYTRDLVLSGIATASLTLQVARQRAFAFTATGASALTKGQVFLRSLAFNASGAATTLVQQLVSVSSSMTATGTALLARTHHWTLAFGPVAAGTAAVQKLVGMSRGFAASGAAAFTSLYATSIGRAYSATGAVSRTASLTVSQVRSVAASGSVALRRAIGKVFNYIGRATVSLTGDGITPPSGRGILRLLVRTVLRDKTRDR